MDKQEFAEMVKEARHEETISELVGAIKVMRDFLDNAEREINRPLEQASLTRKVASVQHELVWGLANANSRIGNALRAAVEYETIK